MRELVLSNIIDFVTINDINEVNHVEFAMSEGCNTGDIIAENSKNLIWSDISREFKFDKISIHLLENFSNAVEGEDYMSASKMKKEILSRWECRTEDDFWEIGREYLFTLKQGLKKSKMLKYLFESVKELEHLWVTRKMGNLNFIVDELSVISDNISSNDREKISNEVILTIDYSATPHPLLTIENVVTFFKLLQEKEE
tara:strand:- start:3969 stop:4565 length:597 start_codon:yes stop_codon:yes gene_type:complete